MPRRIDEPPIIVPRMKLSPATESESDTPSVLLVEDHADMRAYLRKHLSPHYQILEAARGDEGLRLARTELPDVIVADIMMPGLDGHALCRALKSDPETDFIPIILLTARTGMTSRLEGLEGGADDYLTKPFEPAELLLRIRNLLRARARSKARYSAPAPAASRPPMPRALAPLDAAFVQRLQDVLADAFPDPEFDVTALAARLGSSRAQLHRRVAAACRSTPAEVLLRFRLERAAQMLARRAGNVSEIAFAVGFKNVSHFVKRFREHHGHTPTAYAAQPGPATRPT